MKRLAITRRPDTQSGRYCLAGTRMPVVQVKRMMLDPEAGRVWIKREFPWITDEQIDAAMAFRAPSTIPPRQRKDRKAGRPLRGNPLVGKPEPEAGLGPTGDHQAQRA